MTIKEWLEYRKELKEAKKQTKEVFERRLFEIKEKNKLINSQSNWTMLEYFIQQCNENPNLRVKIRTRDGTQIEMKTYEVQRQYEFEKINGVVYGDNEYTIQ